jgi:hypothetical protein
LVLEGVRMTMGAEMTGMGVSGGSGSGTTTKIYCQEEDDLGAVTGCNEHTVPNAAVETSRDACTNEGGLLVTACPTAGLIGKCAYVGGALVMHFYVDGGDVDDAQQICMGIGGVWSDP